MPALVINGRALAEKVTQAVSARIASMERKPGLAVILVGDDEASHVYVDSKIKKANEIGVAALAIRLSQDVSEDRVLREIGDLNARPDIDGILVQLPLPQQVNALRVMAAIDPAKDVDGLHALNAGRLMQGNGALIPCTPLGCMKIIRSVLPDITGRHAVVIGSSNIVGKPVAALLLEAKATVTQTHIHTGDLPAICSAADILVSAVGKAGLVKGSWIKPNAIVIDVGTSFIPTEAGRRRIVGDVVFEDALKVAGAITPVPGGVGPMTIACLMENTLSAALARRPETKRSRVDAVPQLAG